MSHWCTSRLRENVLSLFTLQAATLAAPLISVPYLVRALGPENYGRIAVAQALIQYFVLLTDYGFNLSATRQVSAARSESAQISRLFSAVTIVKLGLLLAGFGVMSCIVSVFSLFEHDWPLYLAAYASVVGSVVFPVWLFQGLERMRAVATCQILAQALSLIAIFTLVQGADDYRLAALIQAATTLVAGLFALFSLGRTTQVRFMWPGWPFLRTVLADGWHVFLSTVALSLYTNTTTLVLGWLTNPLVVGYFAAADKLVRAVQGLLTPISQSAYPHVARLAAESSEEALAFIRKLLHVQGMATLFVSAVLLVLAGPLVDLVFGPLFAPAKPVLEFMSLLPFLIGVSNVFGVQTMLNFDMKQAFSRIMLASGLLNLALLFPLVTNLGASGAAVSLLITEICVTAAMAVALDRRGLMLKLLRRAAA